MAEVFDLAAREDTLCYITLGGPAFGFLAGGFFWAGAFAFARFFPPASSSSLSDTIEARETSSSSPPSSPSKSYRKGRHMF